VWAVLTTRETDVALDRWRDARRLVLRAVRRRWPSAEYVAVTEFTTGYGPRSGGRRRPHLNLLLKGIPPDGLDDLERVVVEVWTRHLDAKPDAQFVGPVAEVGGLMRYLALHFLKESQQPPKGWRGARAIASRGYFGQPTWKVRRAAQASLRSKRELHRALAAGYTGNEAELVAELAQLRAQRTRWEIVKLHADPITGEVRARALDGSEPRVMRADPTADLDARLTRSREEAGYDEYAATAAAEARAVAGVRGQSTGPSRRVAGGAVAAPAAPPAGCGVVEQLALSDLGPTVRAGP
jgi:hypothetical protein